MVNHQCHITLPIALHIMATSPTFSMDSTNLDLTPIQESPPKHKVYRIKPFMLDVPMNFQLGDPEPNPRAEWIIHQIIVLIPVSMLYFMLRCIVPSFLDAIFVNDVCDFFIPCSISFIGNFLYFQMKNVHIYLKGSRYRILLRNVNIIIFALFAIQVVFTILNRYNSHLLNIPLEDLNLFDYILLQSYSFGFYFVRTFLFTLIAVTTFKFKFQIDHDRKVYDRVSLQNVLAYVRQATQI